jgi:hypothetical protein
MAFLSIILAAAASFALGAVCYMALADPWMEAAGIARDADGKPEGGQTPAMFAITFALQLIVAGAMRYGFELGDIESIGKGLLGGFGFGAFFIAPWIAINNLYGNRPARLTLIDSGYAVLGCSAMGVVLTLL